MLFSDPLQAQEAYTPKPGSAERKQISDLVREKGFSSSVEFVIKFLRIEGNWAGFEGLPQERSTKESLETTCTALLFKGSDGKWAVRTLNIHGDVLTPKEFTQGELIPLSVFPDNSLKAELYQRENPE